MRADWARTSLKPGSGLRYADVLVIEAGGPAGGTPRVETFSFKSRDFALLDEKTLKARLVEDAREALQKYGGTLDIRRGALQSHLPASGGVPVQRVRLVYEGNKLKPTKVDELDAVVTAAEKDVPGVEVLFQ